MLSNAGLTIEGAAGPDDDGLGVILLFVGELRCTDFLLVVQNDHTLFLICSRG